jgi:hypothetical protein
MAITKIPAAGFTGNNFRNIIINGDMSIAQRGTSVTGLGNGDSGYHTVDRWKFNESGAPTFEFTMTQDTDVPSGQGFSKSMKLACTTSQASLATDDNLRFLTIIEGQNLQYLKYGTSNAESTTLSFWIKSNKTGDYSVALYNGDTVDIITKTITINSADTWEKKTLTFAGDTGNAFNNDNGASLYLWINLLAGTDYNTSSAVNWTSYSAGRLAYGQTVNLADSTSNYINITGVQLEAGTTASDFEFLPVDVNLQRCLRYYELLGSGDNYPLFNAFNYTSTTLYSVASTQVVMRTNPSVDQTTGTSYYKFIRDNSNDFFDSISVDIPKTNSIELFNDSEISGTAGQAGWVRLNNASSYLALDAEL